MEEKPSNAGTTAAIPGRRRLINPRGRVVGVVPHIPIKTMERNICEQAHIGAIKPTATPQRIVLFSQISRRRQVRRGYVSGPSGGPAEERIGLVFRKLLRDRNASQKHLAALFDNGLLSILKESNLAVIGANSGRIRRVDAEHTGFAEIDA